MMSFADIVLKFMFSTCPETSEFACASRFGPVPRTKPHDRRTLSISIKQKAMWGNHIASCANCSSQTALLAFLATTELPLLIDGAYLYFPPLADNEDASVKIVRQIAENTDVNFDAVNPIRALSNNKFRIFTAERTWDKGMASPDTNVTVGLGIRAGLSALELANANRRSHGVDPTDGINKLCSIYQELLQDERRQRGTRYFMFDDETTWYINLSTCFWEHDDRDLPRSGQEIQVFRLVQMMSTVRVVALNDNRFSSEIIDELVVLAKGRNSIDIIDLHNTNICLKDAKRLAQACFANGVFLLDLRQTWMTPEECKELKEFVDSYRPVTWTVVLASSVDLPISNPAHRSESMCFYEGQESGRMCKCLLDTIRNFIETQSGSIDDRLHFVRSFDHLCESMDPDALLEMVYAVYPNMLELLGASSEREIIELGCTVEEIIETTPEVDYKRATLFGKALGLAIQ